MPIHIKQSTEIRACGNKPKVIKEYIGRVSSATRVLSIAYMDSPAGWMEPGQAPDFDEYTVVLEGILRVKTKDSEIDVRKGQAVIVHKWEWVQYSTPVDEGAKYIAVCLPAFTMESVHRDQEEKALK